MATKITTRVLADDAVTDAKIADVTLTTATQSASDNTTKIATTAYVTTAIANLADSAPSTLNTLNELAAALGDDANYATTTTNAIAAKLPLAGGTLTGTLNITQASVADTIKLTRTTTSQNNMIKFASAGADKWIIGQRNDSTEHFRFYSYGTSSDVLSIQTDGNVAIAGDLNVVGGQINTGNTSGDHSEFGTDGSGHTFIDASTSGGNLFLQAAGSTKVTIQANGKVGIVPDGAGHNFTNAAAAQSLQIGAYNTSGTYVVPTVGLYYSTVPLLISNGYTGSLASGSIGLNNVRSDNGSSSFTTDVNSNYHAVGIDFFSGTGSSSIDFRTESGSSDGVAARIDGNSIVANLKGSGNTQSSTGLIIHGGGPSDQTEGGVGGATNSFVSTMNRQIVLKYQRSGSSYAHAIHSRHNSSGRGGNTIDFYNWEHGTNAVGDLPTKRSFSIHPKAIELVPTTTTERDLFNTSNLAYDGMLLYNSTVKKFQGRIDGVWQNITAGDDFPVTTDLYARYTGDSFTNNGNTTPPAWADVSGNGRNISATSTSTGDGFWDRTSTTWPTSETNTAGSNGADKEFKCVQFDTTEAMALPDDAGISSGDSDNFTFAYVARYLSGTNDYRIMDSKGGNNLFGFWGGGRGLFFDGTWIVGSGTDHATDPFDWVIIVGNHDTLTSKTKDNHSGNFRSIGTTASPAGWNYVSSAYSATGNRYGLNRGNYGISGSGGELSDFFIAEWCMWDRKLSATELTQVQGFLETKYGI